MSSTPETTTGPDFEIDHPDEYGRYFLNTPREIGFYLDLLQKRGSLVTAYLDEGNLFFLTAIVAVDTENRQISIDPPQAETLLLASLAARQITLVASLDHIKMQLRLTAMHETQIDGRKLLSASIPETLLRLQRREFFRLEPPITQPIHCGIAIESDQNEVKTLDLKASDISGGGICVNAPTEMADDFKPNTLFRNCRLDIPGEGVLLVNLRVRKAVEFSAHNGQHHLRVGCEFVSLPGTRLAMIERYITRIERERKARDSGLVD
jgi:flagellar brake protein